MLLEYQRAGCMLMRQEEDEGRRGKVCACWERGFHTVRSPQKLAGGGMRKRAGGGEGLVDRGRSVQTTPWLPTGLLASVFPVCAHPQLHVFKMLVVHSVCLNRIIFAPFFLHICSLASMVRTRCSFTFFCSDLTMNHALLGHTTCCVYRHTFTRCLF